MRKVIYTCLFGNYDKLQQPLVVNDDFDYICFSNDFKENKIGVWKIKRIHCNHITNSSRLSRYAKILPHQVLNEYDYSVYLDANIQIKKSFFYDVINKRIAEGQLIYQVPHLVSNCIYEEIRKAYFAGRVSWKDAKRQYHHLVLNRFPTQYGLFENNILLRKHNDEKVIEISDAWWEEYINFSKRDQFCLMYVYWKHDYMPSYLFDSMHNVRNAECLTYLYHSKGGKFESQLNRLDRNNPLRKMGRLLHTQAKNILIKLFLNKKVD